MLTGAAVAAKRKPLADHLLRLARRPKPTPVPTPKTSKAAKGKATPASKGGKPAPPKGGKKAAPGGAEDAGLPTSPLKPGSPTAAKKAAEFAARFKQFSAEGGDFSNFDFSGLDGVEEEEEGGEGDVDYDAAYAADEAAAEAEEDAALRKEEL